MDGERSRPSRAARALAGLALAWSAAAPAGEWAAEIAPEVRIFTASALDPRQEGPGASLAVRAEYRHAWDDGRQVISFVPFVRLDAGDPERTHADLRELSWVRAAERWELRLGVRRVFWGVAESHHLVDVINQTDLVEDLDGEDRLGQPMANLALVGNWGTLDLYALPGFRERTFPGVRGRLRTVPRVDPDRARFESGAGRGHVDWAVRWSRSAGVWDLGLAHFHGTAREPRLRPEVDAGGAVVLAPLYEIVDQTSLDLQATVGAWAWKLEALTRAGQGRRFAALVGGFEYTLTGVLGTRADLGVLAEYLHDGRDDTRLAPFEDDVFLGLRLALNDPQSTQALAGVVLDRGSDTRLFSLEASRRLGSRWSLRLEARVFAGDEPGDALFPLRRDDHVRVEVVRYF